MKRVFYLTLFVAFSALIAVKVSANSSNELSFLQFEPTNTPIQYPYSPTTPILIPTTLINTPTPTLPQFINFPTSTPIPKLNISKIPVATVTSALHDAQLSTTPTPLPTPTKILMTKDELIKMAREKERNLKVVDFTPILDTNEIDKEITKELNATDKDALKEAAENAAQDKELQKFVNEQLDIDKSIESIEHMQYWAKKHRQTQMCISYFESLFNNFTKENYNKSRIYEERAGKLGVAYSLYKAQYKDEIPWSVDATFWEMLDEIHSSGETSRSYISYIRREVQGYNGGMFNSALPDNAHCQMLVNDYFTATKVHLYMIRVNYYVDNQIYYVNVMKDILAQFNEEHPFNEDFTRQISYIFGYVDGDPVF